MTNSNRVLLQMDKLIVRRSTIGWLIFAAIALFGVTQGIVRLNHNTRGGYPLVIISGLVFVAAIVQLLITRPRVVIDNEGVSAIVLGRRKFLWKEIRTAELTHKHRSGDVITLILYDNTRYSFMLFGVDVPSEDVYTEIMVNIHNHKVGLANQDEIKSADDNNLS